MEFLKVLMIAIGILRTDSLNLNKTFCQLGEPKHCRCDPICEYYGDCCLETPLEKPIRKADQSFECRYGRYEINKCPAEYQNQKVKFACENADIQEGIVNFIYVYSEDNRLFKNAQCAHCNGVMQYEKVNISSIKCLYEQIYFKTFEQLLSYLISGECFIEFDFYAPYSRSCYSSVISDCCDDPPIDASMKCESSPTWYVFHETGMVFRNIDCCHCNNFTCSNDGSPRQQLMAEIPSYRSFLNFYEWCGTACDTDDGTLIDNSTSPSEKSNGTKIGNVFDSFISNLTLIFSILSLITLLMLMLAYAMIKELQSFGGLLTICLSATIFMMQLLTLFTEVSKSSKGLCKSTACALHFFFLSSFMWMSLFAFDLIKTFYTRASTPHSAYVKLAKFAAVAVSIPGLIIFLCLLLDYFIPNSMLSPHYGTKNCWFNEMWAGLIWFFIPVAVLLLFNVLACIAAFRYLYQTAQDTRHVRDPNGPSFSRSMFFLVLKITTLFGVFWLFQIVSVFIRNIVLMDVIGLVNSLQGFLIGVCFLATKRVKKAAQNTFSKLSSSNIFKSSTQTASNNTHH